MSRKIAKTPKTTVKKFRGLDFGWIDEGNKSGPLVIFLHGFPDGPSVWDFQAEHFHHACQVVRPYLRGNFPSEPAKNVSRYGLDAMALDLLEMLDVIDPKRVRSVILVGHDLGGTHAWNVAPLLGTRLKGLVIINSLSAVQMARRFTDVRQQLRSWYMYFMQLPVLPEMILRGLGSIGHGLTYARAGLIQELQPKDFATTKQLPYLLNAYRAFAREIKTQLARKVPRLDAPVLVIWGNEDNFLLPPRTNEIEPFAKRVTIRIIQGNHWVFRERASEVNQLIEEFIESLGEKYEQTMASGL